MGTPAEIIHLVRECNIIDIIAQYVRMYALLGHDEVIKMENWGNERASWSLLVFGIGITYPVLMISTYSVQTG